MTHALTNTIGWINAAQPPVTGPAPALAWRPFIDPIDAHGAWMLLMVPLVVGLAVGYKALRVGGFERYWRSVLAWSGMVIAGMVGLALAVYLIADVLVRWAAHGG